MKRRRPATAYLFFSKFQFFIVTALIATACGNSRKLNSSAASISNAFKNDFLIGAALNQQKLADAYESLFKIFLKHSDVISRVTFWGVDDGHSWLNGFPVRGRTNYPLLFDRNYKPKAAYYRLLALKKK